LGNKYGSIRYKWLAEKGFNVLQDRHQHAYMQALWATPDQVQAVFCNAKAGTGKTTLAVLAGAYEIEKGTYDKMIYVRSAVPVRDQGFLPGDLDDKEAPYMAPLIDALDHIQPGTYERWLKPDQNTGQPKLVSTSTSYTRGINWNRSFVIIDEAQNLSLDELRVALTRCHDDCKVVVIGSTRQIDNKKLQKLKGLTPFEIMQKHFEGTPVVNIKLQNCYRGWFADHADNVEETIEKLRG
jgi:predicted ribonuclease YlaK